jgi:Skp family chaperone for outer membrane proteins
MRSLGLILLALLCHSFAAAETVGTVHLTQAMLESRDGQAARAYLESKFAPDIARLKNEEDELRAARQTLEQRNTRKLRWLPWRRHADRKLAADLVRKKRDYGRHQEEVRAALENERKRVLAIIGKRLVPFLDAYAKEHGFSFLIRTDLNDTPVLAASAQQDVTQDIVAQYNARFPELLHFEAPR